MSISLVPARIRKVWRDTLVRRGTSENSERSVVPSVSRFAIGFAFVRSSTVLNSPDLYSVILADSVSGFVTPNRKIRFHLSSSSPCLKRLLLPKRIYSIQARIERECSASTAENITAKYAILTALIALVRCTSDIR